MKMHLCIVLLLILGCSRMPLNQPPNEYVPNVRPVQPAKDVQSDKTVNDTEKPRHAEDHKEAVNQPALFIVSELNLKKMHKAASASCMRISLKCWGGGYTRWSLYTWGPAYLLDENERLGEALKANPPGCTDIEGRIRRHFEECKRELARIEEVERVYGSAGEMYRAVCQFKRTLLPLPGNSLDASTFLHDDERACETLLNYKKYPALSPEYAFNRGKAVVDRLCEYARSPVVEESIRQEIEKERALFYSKDGSTMGLSWVDRCSTMIDRCSTMDRLRELFQKTRSLVFREVFFK